MVIRVTTLYASTASATAPYYTRYLTDAPEEVPGLWAGRQADLLGVNGVVSTEALERMLSGHDPVTDALLGMPFTDRTLANGKVIRAVAGFDATVSAPKSVSVLWGLTGDVGFVEAHDVAVRAVLSHLERFGSTTRVRSNGGRLHPGSQGLMVAGFRQSTSRADDPQLHTHLVISSKVQTGDGRWLALDARMLKRYQRTLGGIYQSVLRAELTQRYGVAFGEIVKGQAEIAGVPTELLELFSKRAAQVDDALTAKIAEFYAREGRDPTMWEKAALTREAAADTRHRKTDHPVSALRPGWIADAAAIGITPETLIADVGDAARSSVAVPDATVNDVLGVLSASGSVWHREDLVRVFCDLQRPVAGVGGSEWAQLIEAAADRVIEQCVDLDPNRVSGRVRECDGRSEWIEPVAAHITSEPILVQEETILAWALDASAGEPRPSTSVATTGLDVLQHDAAAAVAGEDRLVVIVGPAGTGKTTMLRAAVEDLHRQGRHVYGVSTTAKAARTLERETGMRSDTIAKLVHEWGLPERPPDPERSLPPGTTLIVDEAGMIGTPNLHRLIELADQQQWRLALVGDPRQLQAVGRGGMFAELCITTRTIELEHVHRFSEPWEAAASLLLRQGDPRGLDIYQAHGRIRAGTLAEHLDHFATTWITNNNAGDTTALMASTNQQVDLINEHVQTVRRHLGHIDDERRVLIGGGESAAVGDVVATRRNNRHLITTTGERVRNRDLWTVTATHGSGDLTLTPVTGNDVITLPAAYVAEHVRLGYAATEMGTQSDTVSASVELASTATSCRNLYVAMTRGRNDNTVCVVTDSHDIGDARDVLDAIIAVDRADIPATTQRRTLSGQDRQVRSVPPLQPRCVVPDWFDTLRADTVGQLDHARDNYHQQQRRATELNNQIIAAERQLRIVERYAQPFNDAVTAAETALTAATDNRQSLHDRLATAKRRERRTLQPELAAAEQEFETATVNRDSAVADAGPARTLTAQAITGLRDLRHEQTRQQIYDRWLANPDTIGALQDRLDALDTWRRWAAGHQLTKNQIEKMNASLYIANDSINEYFTLRTALFNDPNTAAIIRHVGRDIERSRGPELSID